MNLHTCEGVLEDQETKKGCFIVVTQPRTFKFVAGNKNEMTEWMTSIKTAIQELPPKPQAPTPAPGNEVSKLSEAVPGLKIGNDFFTQEERTSPHEVEAVLLDLIFTALERRSVL